MATDKLEERRETEQKTENRGDRTEKGEHNRESSPLGNNGQCSRKRRDLIGEMEAQRIGHRRESEEA
jgi:hypothetical protein